MPLAKACAWNIALSQAKHLKCSQYWSGHLLVYNIMGSVHPHTRELLPHMLVGLTKNKTLLQCIWARICWQVGKSVLSSQPSIPPQRQWQVFAGTAAAGAPWSLWGALPAAFWGVSAEQTPTPYCVSHAYQVCCCWWTSQCLQAESNYEQSLTCLICRKKRSCLTLFFFPNQSIMEVYVVIIYSAVSQWDCRLLHKMYLP